MPVFSSAHTRECMVLYVVESLQKKKIMMMLMMKKKGGKITDKMKD